MKAFTMEVTDQIGLHARPVSIVISAISKFKSDLTLKTVEGRKANLKSVMQVLSLAVRSGDVVTIEIDGADEDTVFTELKKVLLDNGITNPDKLKVL